MDVVRSVPAGREPRWAGTAARRNANRNFRYLQGFFEKYPKSVVADAKLHQGWCSLWGCEDFSPVRVSCTGYSHATMRLVRKIWNGCGDPNSAARRPCRSYDHRVTQGCTQPNFSDRFATAIPAGFNLRRTFSPPQAHLLRQRRRTPILDFSHGARRTVLPG